MANESMEELYGRIERLTGWRASKGLFVALAIAWFFAFYELVLIGFALPSIVSQFHLTLAESSLVVSLNLAGYVVGAIIMGNVADRIGRKDAFLITLVILSVGAAITSISTTLPVLLIFRTLDGAGVGAEISIASTYVSEMAPRNSRAKINQAEYMAAAFALATGGLVTVGLIRVSPVYGWRIAYAIIVVVAIAGVFIRKKYATETPRWLAIHNRLKEADEVVTKFEEKEIKVKGKLLPVEVVPKEESGEKFPLLGIFQRKYIKTTMVVFLFWFFNYVAYYSWASYGPTLVSDLGIYDGFTIVAVGGIGYIVGGIVSYLYSEKLERKYTMAIIEACYAIGPLLEFFAHTSLLIFIGSFLVSYGAGTLGPAYMYTAEMFPTRTRAAGLTFADGAGHLGGVVGPLITVAIIPLVGIRPTFLLGFSLFAVISFVVIMTLGEKIRNRSLTEVTT